MKLVNKVAVPTTRLEQLALENLKFNCIEKDSIMPLFLPMADENVYNGTRSFISTLCNLYNISDNHEGIIKEWNSRPDGAVEVTVHYPDGVVQEEVLGIPSNLNTMIAYYSAIGRHRKAAMVAKRYKKFI